MDRRAFLGKILAGLVLGGTFLVGGCAKREQKAAKFGNQEKLWKVASGQSKTEEPLALAYAKDTPAFYRDASLGKVDPSFTPKVGGG